MEVRVTAAPTCQSDWFAHRLSVTMFKKMVGFEAVPHRMGGSHAKRDPLLDEKVGSAKRHKVSDNSHMVHYKETEEEKQARIRADKVVSSSKKDDGGLQDVLGRDRPRKAAAGNLHDKLGVFKEKLKASNLPAEAAESEKKHREELEAEKEKALAKSSLAAAASAAASAASAARAGGSDYAGAGARALPDPDAPAKEDSDRRIAFAEIWKEGDEESSSDWLSGGGLKFHTTADKAFSMDSKRFKEIVECHDPLENQEAAAERARKRGERKMEDFRRSQKG